MENRIFMLQLVFFIKYFMLVVCIIDEFPYINQDEYFDLKADDLDAWSANKRENTFYNFFVEKRSGTVYNEDEKRQLVDKHNEYRRNVIPTPANMQMMEWDDDLATQAQVWSDRCEYNHPRKVDEDAYYNTGQNLYLAEGKPTARPKLLRPLFLWYNEIKYYHYDAEANRCQTPPKKTCGHFTQVVWAKTKRVGCGVQFCPTAEDYDENKKYKNVWIVTCNYSPSGNRRGLPYQKGSLGSSCNLGLSINGLCSDCAGSGDPNCVCKRECENCGKVSEDCLSCQCSAGFAGAFCEKECENFNSRCGNKWKPRYCNKAKEVRDKCPLMCGQCEPPDANFVCNEEK